MSTAMLIIRDALILCGGLEDDENPAAGQLSHAIRTLNNMVKAFSRKGLKAWKWQEKSLTLVADQASYVIGPTGADYITEYPLTIANVRRAEVGLDDYPVEIISKAEYYDLVDKTSTGEPLQVYYDQQLKNGRLYVWPAPDQAYTLKFSAKVYIESFISQASLPDFPDEWIEALTYNLAVRLAPLYETPQNRLDRISVQAAEMLMDAEGSDKEQGSIFLGMDPRYNEDWN